MADGSDGGTFIYFAGSDTRLAVQNSPDVLDEGIYSAEETDGPLRFMKLKNAHGQLVRVNLDAVLYYEPIPEGAKSFNVRR